MPTLQLRDRRRKSPIPKRSRREERRRAQQLEHELELARSVQRSLFPSPLPNVPGLDLAGLNHPARTVSGDLYDVVVLGPERAAILCADVSGKGFASALMAAEIQAYVRATLRASCVFADPSRGPLPVRVASLVNAELCRHHQASGRYATMFLGEYDARDRSLNYVNAGQNPPLLMSPGGEPAVHLTTGGPPLGLFEDATWEAGTATVPKGGTVLVYTDGVIEARNPDGAEFGMERLIEICSTRCGCDALLGNVMNAVRVWCREGDQADDITLLAFAPGAAPVAS